MNKKSLLEPTVFINWTVNPPFFSPSLSFFYSLHLPSTTQFTGMTFIPSIQSTLTSDETTTEQFNSSTQSNQNHSLSLSALHLIFLSFFFFPGGKHLWLYLTNHFKKQMSTVKNIFSHWNFQSFSLFFFVIDSHFFWTFLVILIILDLLSSLNRRTASIRHTKWWRKFRFIIFLLINDHDYTLLHISLINPTSFILIQRQYRHYTILLPPYTCIQYT